jgi:iron complex outermembrane receptor protein
MKIVLHLTFLALFSGLTSAAFAQFPGGGGGGGGRGGGDFRGGGDRQRQTVIPGTAEDTPKGSGKNYGLTRRFNQQKAG